MPQEAPQEGAAPSPWTGATSSPPGPALQDPLGAPSPPARHAAPGGAAQARTPTACCASTSPRGPHWTASDPTVLEQVCDKRGRRPRERLCWKTPEGAYTHRALRFL